MRLFFYCKYFEEADEYVRNFIFNIINYPHIHITIPYNGANIEHDSTLLIESTVSDNSDTTLISNDVDTKTTWVNYDDVSTLQKIYEKFVVGLILVQKGIL